MVAHPWIISFAIIVAVVQVAMVPGINASYAKLSDSSSSDSYKEKQMKSSTNYVRMPSIKTDTTSPRSYPGEYKKPQNPLAQAQYIPRDMLEEKGKEEDIPSNPLAQAQYIPRNAMMEPQVNQEPKVKTKTVCSSRGPITAGCIAELVLETCNQGQLLRRAGLVKLQGQIMDGMNHKMLPPHLFGYYTHSVVTNIADTMNQAKERLTTSQLMLTSQSHTTKLTWWWWSCPEFADTAVGFGFQV